MLRTQSHAPHGATLHAGAIAAMISSGMTAETGRTASNRHPNLGENEQHSARTRHDRDRHHGGMDNNGRTTHGTIDGPSDNAQTLMFGNTADPTAATAMTANDAGATIGLHFVEPGARLLN